MLFLTATLLVEAADLILGAPTLGCLPVIRRSLARSLSNMACEVPLPPPLANIAGAVMASRCCFADAESVMHKSKSAINGIKECRAIENWLVWIMRKERVYGTRERKWKALK